MTPLPISLVTDESTTLERWVKARAYVEGVPTALFTRDLKTSVSMDTRIADCLRLAEAQGWGEVIWREDQYRPNMRDQMVWATAWKRPDGHLLYVAIAHGVTHLQVSRPTMEECIALAREFRAKWPVPEFVPVEEKPEVVVNFWAMTPTGPDSSIRILEVTPWPSQQGNYTAAAQAMLAPLMEDYLPGSAGRLLLWHGVPGTGKTYALRSLAWAWRQWATVHYIADPEVFFANPLYMFKVIGEGGRDPNSPSSIFDSDDADEYSEEELAANPRYARKLQRYREQKKRGGHWNLIVLEDCGELIAQDAKERTGQGLSRLLNIVDGLMGQGLRFMTLITTNEPVLDLHEAVRRPGRAAQVLEFGKLDRGEANDWLAAQGAQRIVRDEKSIAELYDIVRGERGTKKHAERKNRSAGFAAATTAVEVA